MHFHSYLTSAKAILEAYDGATPFVAWLKLYFGQNKKFGSRDRKHIADLCFCYYRLGKAFLHTDLAERLLIGQFLCHQESVFLQELKPEWKEKASLSVEEKTVFLDATQLHSFFSLEEELSNKINKKEFQISMLLQPDFFLRLRPGKEKIVAEKLAKAGIQFNQQNHFLRLSNNTKIDSLIRLDEEAVVQDFSSQQVLTPLLLQQTLQSNKKLNVWDCCAASGGKTILFHDAFPKARLTVSDIRESILHNLKNRFRRAGIHQFTSFVADVSVPDFLLKQQFDVIICDAPCSGSGTWSRTPEQLTFFRPEKIAHYTNLQPRIAVNASKCLKEGGFFLYITCSVFLKENEEVVNYVQQHTRLQLLSQQYFKGFNQRADTLFAALFTL